MPVTAPYISAKVAMIRLANIPSQLDKVADVIKGLPDEVAKAYKNSLLSFIEKQIQIATDESIVYALAGASESGTKNSLLTPLIDFTIVNPAEPTNLAEIAAMILDGTNTAQTLQQLLSNATTILS